MDPQDMKQKVDVPHDMPPEHYYGDYVRKLFLAGSIIVIVFTPFFRDLLPLNTSFVLVLIILATLLAGIMSPKHRLALWADVIVAAIAVFVFEYHAIAGYVSDGFDLVTILRQALALIFLFALYFSAKTLRGTPRE